MIELRGLHLGNIARSPAESVRPDLWPDHAWVPALGCTGGVLYDLCGGRVGVNSAGLWNPQGMYLDTDELVTYNRASLLTGWGARFWSSPFTVLVDYTPLRALSGKDVCVLGAWKSGNNASNQLMLGSNYRSTDTDFYPYFVVRIGTTEYPVYHTPQYTVGQRMVIGGIRNGTVISLARDGAIVANAGCAAGAINTSNLPLVFGGISFGGAYNTNAMYHATSIHLRALAAREIAELSADPILPFRRRQPVYYSVPSGGGASLAASSAWRVFTAAAINTAWAIRAALDGATGWAVLTQSRADTGWRIAAASDAETAWNLRAAAASPSAWSILTASEADTAWRIAADLDASTAWAILTNMDAATAWAIIAAGTLMANTGWAIRTEADADTGWMNKTDTAADTAWAVRNASEAATAWDIQAALAGATAWRITTDLQADTAWTVITGMDADAAWNILRADPTGTAWQVCTDLDTPTSWAVFSDIIPEPVRLFLAPGRQFIINAVSRVLIITKTRP